VDRNDIEDEQLGFYNPIVAALAQEARKHPEKLLADLMSAGFTTACYDGQYFFDTDHPVGSATASNFGGGSGTPWYLLDTSRAIKPFIFQLRREVQLVRMDRQEDEHAFMRKKYRYGVDYRGAAAYGLWQLAYSSKETLNPTNYAVARTAMMSLTNSEGRPLGIKPSMLLVPPSLEALAREILQAQFIIGDPAAGGAKSNIWQGTADLLVVPELA
jgi:phage major head subunit gpT-like protein